jgi:hypothetical protein
VGLRTLLATMHKQQGVDLKKAQHLRQANRPIMLEIYQQAVGDKKRSIGSGRSKSI